MAEQDELAADTQRQKPKKLLRLRISTGVLNPTELVFTQSRSLTSVRNYQLSWQNIQY